MMSKSGVGAACLFTFVVAFLLGVGVENEIWQSKDYVKAYKKAETEIKMCQAELPRNQHCKVFYTYETKVK